MRLVSIVSICVLVSLKASHSEARTRTPKTENERSLLYWRYLCENQPQIETSKPDHASNSPVELACPSQRWKVHADGEIVREVIEDAQK